MKRLLALALALAGCSEPDAPGLATPRLVVSGAGGLSRVELYVRQGEALGLVFGDGHLSIECPCREGMTVDVVVPAGAADLVLVAVGFDEANVATRRYSGPLSGAPGEVAVALAPLGCTDGDHDGFCADDVAPFGDCDDATASASPLGGCPATPPVTGDVALDGDGESDASETVLPKGKFAEPCLTGDDCESGYCVPGPSGSVCTETCGECKAGWLCATSEVPGEDALCVAKAVSGCKSLEGWTRPCDATVAGVGSCSGVETCGADQKWSACSASTPTAEVCNALDDDCDGDTDEEFGTGVDCTLPGECGKGLTVCVTEATVACSTEASKTDETCNAKDDDCDGDTDEDLDADSPTLPCLKTLGVCEAAKPVAVCQGAWTCDYSAVPGYEATETQCDGKDNDCDGDTDDPGALTATGIDCGTDGVCAGVLPECGGANGWKCPFPATHQGSETLCDDLDNDCDGDTDEGFPDKGASCPAAVGPCQPAGVLVCNASHDGLVCSTAPLGAAEPCDDGDPCTFGDACTGGEASACAGTATICVGPCSTCDGEGGCTVKGGTCLIDGACQQVFDVNPSNACEHCAAASPTSWTPRPKDTFCDDGKPCTESDACTGSGACAGEQALCNDQDPCTFDTCNPETGCANPPKSCDDQNPCTDDSCDPATDCVHTPVDANCLDADKCDLDTCGDDGCTHTLVTCDDGVACTADGCQESTGCVFVPSHDACPDGDACTQDVCDPALGCTHPVTVCSDGIACTLDGCSKSTGCSETPLDISCNDDDVCTVDTCHPKKGCQYAPVECDDGIACTADACTSPAGCESSPDDALCDDGVACTADHCDGVECTATPVDAACDDGNSCTTDSCAAGGCVPGLLTGPACAYGTCADGLCVPDASPLSAGSATTCLRAADQTLSCWGNGVEGQTGTGFPGFHPSAVAPANLPPVVRQCNGSEFTCAVTTTGGVYCWGKNDVGQAGDATKVSKATPAQVPGVALATDVTCGFQHACALLEDGSVTCWGANGNGQLGIGATGTDGLPAPVQGLTDVVQLSAAGYHTCAVQDGGALYCWGRNASGELGIGNGTEQTLPVAAKVTGVKKVASGSYSSCALTDGGGMYCWGSNYYGQLGLGVALQNVATPALAQGPANFTDIALGSSHACGIAADRSLWCWGWNFVGQLGLGSTANQSAPVKVDGLKDVMAVAAGFYHTCALLGDTSVRCFGANSEGQLGQGAISHRTVPAAVPGTYLEAACGTFHTCAVTTTGQARCWGSGTYGQLGNGAVGDAASPLPVAAALGAAKSIAAGANHTCALTTDGLAYCWGRNESGQLGKASTALIDQVIPVKVDQSVTFSKLALGAAHSCGLRASNSSAYCWGNKDFIGGGGVNAVETTPTFVKNLSPIVDITASNVHTCAALSDGTAWCWGQNAHGELGDGTQTTSAAPVKVKNLPAVTSITAGALHTCALTASGDAYCWGRNLEGQLGLGYTSFGQSVQKLTSLQSASALFAGDYHTCAATGSGLFCFGYNLIGTLGNGTFDNASLPQLVTGELKTTTSLAAGKFHMCAVAADGALSCWGNNSEGEVGDGTGFTTAPSAKVVGLVP